MTPRVLHITPGLEHGGAETMLLQWVRALPEYEHHVLNLQHGGSLSPLLQHAGATLHSAHMARGRPSAMGIWRTLALARRLQPHVLQGWMYHGNLAAWLCRQVLPAAVPVVWTVHNAATTLRDVAPATRLWAGAAASISPAINRIVYVAASSQRAHEMAGYSRAHSSVIAGGVAPADFVPQPQAAAALRQAWELPTAAPCIGMIARLHPIKDHPTFLRAAALAPASTHFILVGAGLCTAPPHLQACIAADLAPRLHWLGTRHDIAAILQACDICTLASRSEALPRVLLEALASGTSCVATDVGDCAALLQAVGTVVTPGDPQGLCQGWQTELHHPQRAARRWRGQQRIRSGYTLDHMAARARALYSGLL